MRNICFFTVGRSALRVAHEICRSNDFLVEYSPTIDLIKDLPPADVFVFIASNPCPNIEINLSSIAHSRKAAMIPIVYSHPFVRTGPIFSPKGGTCAICYFRRLRQHTSKNLIEEAMNEKFERELDQALPKGILFSWVKIGAALGKMRMNTDFTQSNVDYVTYDFDDVVSVNFLSGQVIKGKVVGVDGCNYCDIDISQYRSLDDLRSQLVGRLKKEED